jgi:hypothetical protein
LLTGDESLTAAGTNVALQSHMAVSIRTADAFDTLFGLLLLRKLQAYRRAYNHLHRKPSPRPQRTEYEQ